MYIEYSVHYSILSSWCFCPISYSTGTVLPRSLIGVIRITYLKICMGWWKLLGSLYASLESLFPPFDRMSSRDLLCHQYLCFLSHCSLCVHMVNVHWWFCSLFHLEFSMFLPHICIFSVPHNPCMFIIENLHSMKRSMFHVHHFQHQRQIGFAVINRTYHFNDHCGIWLKMIRESNHILHFTCMYCCNLSKIPKRRLILYTAISLYTLAWSKSQQVFYLEPRGIFSKLIYYLQFEMPQSRWLFCTWGQRDYICVVIF